MSTYEDGTPMAGYEHERQDDPSATPGRRMSPPPGVKLLPPAPPAMRPGELLVDYQNRTGRLPDPETYEAVPDNDPAHGTAEWYRKRWGVKDGFPRPQPAQPKGAQPVDGAQQKDDGLAYRDPHDAGYEAPEAERPAFDKYRYTRGHEIVPPPMLATDTRFSQAQIASVAREAGVAASHAGLSPVAAQAAFNVVADGYTPPAAATGFDLDRGLSEVRLVLGQNTDQMIEEVQRYVATKPALAAYLDETSLGNHPKVLMALAAFATRPSLQTKAGAQAYLAELKKADSQISKSYFSGDKYEVFVARLAHEIAFAGESRSQLS